MSKSMPLKIRILLWVFILFIATLLSIFVISTLEINSSLKKEETALVLKVKEVGKENFVNIEKYLDINFNNAIQKINSVFESMRTSSQWRLRFLPDQETLINASWGPSAAVLATFPWLDLINIEIDGKETAYIYEAAPFLRKFIKLGVAEDLSLFVTMNKQGYFDLYVGVPFWSNQVIRKYLDDSAFPDFFLANTLDQWLLYDIKELLAIDPKGLTSKKNQLYKHLFDEAITLHSQEEIDFLFNSLKIMIEKTQENLLKQKGLLKILSDPSTKEQYIDKKIKEIHPDIKYQRTYCKGPLCEVDTLYMDPTWATRRDFQHKITQKQLIWELCMLTRTGAWDFSPFNRGSPMGVVTSLAKTEGGHEDFFDNVLEGFFIHDVFLNKKINIEKTCTLAVGNSAYDRKVIFKDDPSGEAKSCKNAQLEILFDEDLKEPFLTNTNYISYFKPPMKEPSITAITLGISLDPILFELALVSPDEIACVFKDGSIRLYKSNGEIKNIPKDPNDTNRLKLLTETEGSLIDPSGKKLYFAFVTNITDNDGKIVLIEKQESRITLIDTINAHIKKLIHHVIINASVLIIFSLILIMIILSRIIGAITKPINQLAEAVSHVTDRTLDNVRLDKKQSFRKDEVGALYKAFTEMIQSMKEGHKVRGLLDKVVSKQVAAKIVKEGIKLGGEKKIISVMFCDIRNFTGIAENMDPEKLLVMLNDCLTLLSGVIDDFEGVIDKYEGDKIMTLFGAPLETPNHPLKAVLCALEMQRKLSMWNSIRENNHLPKLEVGIGIHTGEAVAGNVGAENHLSYTVLGHIVNLSARLCDFAKANEILITSQTLEGIKDHIVVKENPPHQFKGITHEVVTFSVIGKKDLSPP